MRELVERLDALCDAVPFHASGRSYLLLSQLPHWLRSSYRDRACTAQLPLLVVPVLKKMLLLTLTFRSACFVSRR